MFNSDDIDHLFIDQHEKEAYEMAKKIDEIRIGHDFFIAAFDGIKNCMKASAFSREPVNCMLLGDGGTGKTSLAKIFQNMLKPVTIVENDLTVETVPVFYTSFKSARTLEALSSDILLKLNDPTPGKGKLGDKAIRIIKLLKQCRTKIIFVDEMHDLDGLFNKNRKQVNIFMKWIKELSNECGPLICLMGLRSCKDVFEGDTEMTRRFKHKFILQKLSPGTKSNPGLLQKFLRDFSLEVKKRTSIQTLPPLDEYLNALRIYVATNGNLDFLATLIKTAVLNVLLEKRTQIDIEDLAKIWDTGILNDSTIVKFNPFRASENEIAAALRKQIR